MCYNVISLHEFADRSGLSSLCQDRTFFVKTKSSIYPKPGKFLKRELCDVLLVINILP